MTVTQSIILGIIQGITEFIPISSSGHLVILPYLLGWDIPKYDAFIFDVLVQVATLAAVLIYFWSDLVDIVKGFIHGLLHRSPFENSNARLGWYLIVATIPAGIIGLGLKDIVARAFASPLVTAGFLFLTAILLVLAEKVGRREKLLEELNWKDALWIGLSQVIAIFPGVSRSGATIFGGMTRDLKRPDAARFSFLMSIPIMLAAGLSAVIDLTKIPHLDTLLPTFIPGFLAAAIVGYLVIRWLISYLTHHPLYIFAVYCAGLGSMVLIWSFFML
ncbi:undecaprenyl-diphosphatase UppP [Chloroflexota bacterium]